MSNKPNLFIYRCVPREQWQWVPENCQPMPHKLSFFLWFQVSHPRNMFSSQPKIQNAPMKLSGALFLHSSLFSIILLYKFQLFQPTWIPISTFQFSEATVAHLGSSFLEFVPKLTFYLLVWNWSDCRAHLISCFPSLVIIALQCPLHWFLKRDCFKCLFSSFLVVRTWGVSSGLVISSWTEGKVLWLLFKIESYHIHFFAICCPQFNPLKTYDNIV